MKKILFICLMLFIGMAGVFAQTGTISGKVTDNTGAPMPGVTVVVKGTTQGTISDIDGNFSISVASGETLVFSYVGMQTQEIVVTSFSDLSVVMLEDMAQIGEVVVVGYGTMKKESLTAAISNIKSEDITTTKHASLALALQGKVSGLQIRQNTGQPGSFDTRINIRGFGTPLYVIDGVAREGGSEFQRINPEDIESISVLKDAAAAIYGRRGGNGVIIVTTKKGREGKPRFTYNSSVGLQQPTNIPRMANAFEYVTMVNRARTFQGLGPAYDSATVAAYEQGLPGYEGTDWYDATFKDYAFRQSHDFSATGGTDRFTYYASFGYQEDGGILKTNDLGYDKFTFRSNLTAKLTENLSATLSVAGRHDFTYEPGNNFFNIFKETRIGDPTVPVYANNNPDYIGAVPPGNRNPVAFATRAISGYNETANKNLQSSISLTYEVPFIEGLKLKGLYSFDSNNQMNKALRKKFYLYSYDAITETYARSEQGSPSQIRNTWRDFSQLNFQTQVLYQRTFADAHDVSAMVVYEQNKTDYRWASLSRDYDFYTNDQIALADQNNMQNDGNETETGNRSYIGRFNYGYKGKYLLEYAFRRDGSYRYHPDRRWGNFQVVTAGWRISEEAFLQDALPAVSNAKLRVSYGVVGEDAGNPFQYVEGFSTSGGGGYEFTNDTWTVGASAPPIVNANLTWFTSTITDIGFDLGLWKNSLSFEFDVYQRLREGLLATRNVSLPNTFGGTLPQENLNSDMVRGIEAAVALKRNIGEFFYEVRGNFNLARTMNRYRERGPFTSSYDRWRNGNINRYNDVVWGYVLEGQFQDAEEIIMAPPQNGDNGNLQELPGDFKFKDLNGDGVINGGDMKPMFYDGNPKQYYGLTLIARWKGFDLSALLQGAGKYTVRFSEVYAEMFAFRGNTPAYFYDSWTRNDDGTWNPGEWPANRYIADVGSMYKESEMWRKDASYLRLKNIDLGYTFRSQGWTNALGIESLRIYANVYNLFTITDPFVKPFDPEKIEGAHDAGLTYPLTKSYNVGINLNF
jgi:TonB-linked SusC/RagA family outer membrane protein